MRNVTVRVGTGAMVGAAVVGGGGGAAVVGGGAVVVGAAVVTTTVVLGGEGVVGGGVGGTVTMVCVRVTRAVRVGAGVMVALADAAMLVVGVVETARDRVDVSGVENVAAAVAVTVAVAVAVGAAGGAVGA